MLKNEDDIFAEISSVFRPIKKLIPDWFKFTSSLSLMKEHTNTTTQHARNHTKKEMCRCSTLCSLFNFYDQ